MPRRPYVREVPKTTWFLRHPRYMRYMAREVTCFFVGGYSLLMLVGLMRLSQGEAAWNAFLEGLKSPFSVVLHLLALAFTVYNTVTWFNVTPKALPIQVGEEFVPGIVITGAHYAGWAVFSVGLFWLAGVI